MLSEEQSKGYWSMLMSITRHHAMVISCDEQMQISSFSLFKNFPVKVDDLTIKIIKIQELSSPKGE